MKKLLSVFIVMGLGFSGYLSGVKFISDICAFGEQCPYFLGFPACYFGFAMYLTMFVLLLVHFFGKLKEGALYRGVLWIAVLGILFAGYFTLREVGTIFTDGLGAFVLGLPTCAWGLLFYIAITKTAWKGTCKDHVALPLLPTQPS
jgi:uncharacterized membrane protein